MDLKTAFLQGEAYDNTRDIICQLLPESGLPSYMGARMKKPAYGLNDAPRRWWNIVDAKLRLYGLVPTRADRCTYVLYSESKSREREDSATNDRTKESNKSTIISHERYSSSFEHAMDYLLDPVAGSPSRGKTASGVVCLHVDDLFMSGDAEFHRVCASLRKDFQVGSEDINDIQFV